jgi:hypothetical protein
MRKNKFVGATTAIVLGATAFVGCSTPNQAFSRL